MTPRQIPTVIGGAALFVAAVAVGALVVVSLSPDERRPVSDAQQGLLIEGMTASKPFNASPAAIVAGQALSDARPDAQALSPGSGAPPIDSPAGTRPEAMPRTRSSSHQANVSVNGSTGEFTKPDPLQARRPDPKPPSRPPIPSPQAAPPGQAAPLPIQPHPDGMLTAIEIRRMRMSLRLTREQEPYWPPVEQALMEISVQQAAMLRAGQDPKDAIGIGAGMRVYSAARPLLDQLREDQKALVRARARAMGFGSIAGSI